MFRSFFLTLSKAAWARQIVTGWPVARQMAGRFVAGDTLQEAIQAIAGLNAKGILATLDHLGENTTTPDEARQATQDILDAQAAVAAAGARANVSIKLTQIGLRLDQDLCWANLERILGQASQHASFVRVDMEDAPTTQITLDLVRRARRAGLPVGTVIQAYLYRSQADVTALAAEGVPVRLCKGAYREPANVAFPKKNDVDANYDRLACILLDAALKRGECPTGDGTIPPLPALATHDPRRIEAARLHAEKIGLERSVVEFQMLFGIRRDLQEELAAAGYPVRVYVPYGTQWYPYFMRRLAERPANVWFILSNLFRR